MNFINSTKLVNFLLLLMVDLGGYDYLEFSKSGQVTWTVLEFGDFDIMIQLLELKDSTVQSRFANVGLPQKELPTEVFPLYFLIVPNRELFAST
jgi:hypothetical protein